MKLLVIQGIPGSGKSTLARKLIKDDNKTIIVNRDDIRSMCGKYWVPDRDDLITVFEDTMIYTALNNEYNVIVDATNLNPKTIEKLNIFARSTRSEIEYRKLIINPLHAYLRVLFRALKGGRYISYRVIRNFYNRYRNTIGVNNAKI